MQLKQVYVRGLHGIFSSRVRFNDDYTFIHGINGTGKTSILRSMQAALEPDLEWISMNKFEVIEIHVENERKKYQFRFEKGQETTVLKMRIGNDRHFEEYKTSRIEFIIHNYARRDADTRSERDVLKNTIFEIYSGSEIIKQIQSIPTPIFLGLNRTSSLDAEFERAVYERRYRPAQGPIYNTTTGDTLTRGLRQALDLIFRRARIISQQRRLLEDRLRNDISFLLFSNPTSGEQEDASDWPRKRDITKYRRMQQEILRTLPRIGLDNPSATRQLNAFFETLISLTRRLQRYDSFHAAVQELSSSNGGTAILSRWFERQPIIRLIERYFSLIEDFNQKERNLRTDLTRFEYIINTFFSDSKKNVVISETGEAKISVGNKYFDIIYLSSGEKQIFVLLTHLIFNPLLKKANVLIIDEPEISLHVRWQEIFVESVRNANSQTQLILATHSPSIVLDRRDNMVDLNAS